MVALIFVNDAWNMIDSGERARSSSIVLPLRSFDSIFAVPVMLYPFNLNIRPKVVSCGGMLWQALQAILVCLAKLGTALTF